MLIAPQTFLTISFFVVAMALYPDVQLKAQNILDNIVGDNRLPEHNDLENIPYIRAILLETLRWRPIAPFGVPHVLSADDVYEGYDIPKGTMCITVSICDDLRVEGRFS